MIDEDRAVEARAQELGLTILEQLVLEANEPWIKHWSARHGRGAANVRAWLEAGLPSADLDALCVSGAPAAVKLVRELVGRLPAPVAWLVTETCAIAWVPAGYALTGPWPNPPARPTSRIDASFTLSERGVGLMVHEIAHVYARNPELFAGLATVQIEYLDEKIRALPGAAERKERSDAMERAADQLASLWLGVKVDTSSTREYGHRLAIGGTP